MTAFQAELMRHYGIEAPFESNSPEIERSSQLTLTLHVLVEEVQGMTLVGHEVEPPVQESTNTLTLPPGVVVGAHERLGKAGRLPAAQGGRHLLADAHLVDSAETAVGRLEQRWYMP